MKQPKEAYDEILALLDNYIEKNKDVANSWVNEAQTARKAFVDNFVVQPITFKHLNGYVITTLAETFTRLIMQMVGLAGFSTLRNDLLKAVASWPSHEDYLEWQVTELKKQLGVKTFEASGLEKTVNDLQRKLAAINLEVAELQSTVSEQEVLLQTQGDSVAKTQRARSLFSDYVVKLKAENAELTKQMAAMKNTHVAESLLQENVNKIQTTAIATLEEQLEKARNEINDLITNPPRNYLTAATSGLKIAAPIAAAPAVTISKQRGPQPILAKR